MCIMNVVFPFVNSIFFFQYLVLILCLIVRQPSNFHDLLCNPVILDYIKLTQFNISTYNTTKILHSLYFSLQFVEIPNIIRMGSGYLYGREGYKDNEYQGRSRGFDQYGSRSRSTDRDMDSTYEDDGKYSSRFAYILFS